MPEFMVIAIVALVVLGPERLPEVMGKVGRAYRQLREMSAQVTGEFQRQWEEGMREVEDVTSTINSTWQGAIGSSGNTAAGPPARLVQAPPPLRAPAGIAEAGPWTLPAWHPDATSEPEPRSAPAAVSPFALPDRPTAGGEREGVGAVGSAGVATGGYALDDPYDHRGSAAAIDRTDISPVGSTGPMGPTGTDTVEGEQAGTPAPAGTPRRPPERAPAAPNLAPPPLRRQGHPEPPLILPGAPVDGPAANGVAANGSALQLGESDDHEAFRQTAREVRERTVIDLYRAGGLTLERAAEFLALSPPEFHERLAHAGRTGS